MFLDPLNAPENEDMSEVEVCRGCRELIAPGTEREGNGWFWHDRCIPLALVQGLMDEQRDAEAQNK